MKRILCLDPGPERTGWCVLDVDDWKVVQTGHADWETVLDMLRRADFAGVAAEAIVMYTFPGASPNNRLVLATNFQLGRVFQVCRDLGVEYRQETRARIIRQLTGLFVYGTKTDDEGARKCVSVSKADMQATVQQLLGLSAPIRPQHANDACCAGLVLWGHPRVQQVADAEAERQQQRKARPRRRKSAA
jgi:hypothetical protein